MDSNRHGRHRWRKRLWPVWVLAALLLLLLVVPPLVSISRYKSRITALISESLGRPVRLSSVELRMFPRPGFEITNLSVAEDPAFGVEPVLHASTVRASVRLLSLWRGRLEIDTISLDDASFNVVHAGPGKWNLASLFRTAASKGGSTGNNSGLRRSTSLPYLEATESRINFKEGAEKLPFSLVNADLELWQENPGDWRIRLRGQPARTDLSLYQEDTGIVRLEASLQHAPTLGAMPARLDLDWRNAQLGQLSRLAFGSDPGWRGDLTGNLHLEGTADSAQVIMRLRAESVHRAEFAPADALDFDANCDLIYHYSRRGFEKLACNSPIGDGRIRITGDRPNAAVPPHLTAELDRVPVAAGLGLLRTVRSGVAADLQASGIVSGKIAYDATVPPPIASAKASRSKRAHSADAPVGPLTGSLAVEGLTLTGGGITQPIQAPKITLAPVVLQLANQRLALAGSTAVPMGGTAPVTLSLNFTTAGYIAGLRGQVSVARARELMRATGMAQAAAFDGLAGDPLTVDLTAAGPWLAAQEIPQPASAEPMDEEQPISFAKPENAAKPSNPSVAKTAIAPVIATIPATDVLAGTVTLRNANWRADYLANHVQIADATLTLSSEAVRWNPVAFSYGPLKGTAALEINSRCAPAHICVPRFTVTFGALDAADLETAILGAQQKGTLLSSLIDRLHPSAAPPWPAFEGSVKADSLLLGPVTLTAPSAEVRIVRSGAQITSISGGLLGGRLDARGSFTRAATDQDKPGYSIEGKVEKMSAASVGQLLGQRWTGGTISANGIVDLAGYTGSDFSNSAQGELHFDWSRGAVSLSAASGNARASLAPVSLARFDHWTGDAAIASGAVTLGENQLLLGLHTDSIEGSVKFGDPPTVSLAAARQQIAEKPDR
ncbi:MAG TPA: AsmA family protein [Terracidiphilus sp.]|nr:AsmA family protein [Terracidiphilus sp.]